MKKEARHLFKKAADSLVLGVELFNRPSDLGRTHAVLIFIDHSFEMLLKAAIVERKGNIFQENKAETIGMSACIRKCLSDERIKFLAPEEVLVLQSLNSLRDAAQHYTVEVSEQQLYFHCQSGLTLFRDIVKRVFEISLGAQLPERVLPLSTTPPVEISAFFQSEVEAIRKCLAPRSRKIVEAKEKLRALAIFEKSVQGIDQQPTNKELNEMLKKIRHEADFMEVFPSVSVLQFTTNGYGPSLDLRIAKKEGGLPITLVPEGTPGASVVAVKRVNELDFYSLNISDIAEKVGISRDKILTVFREFKIQDDPEYFKMIKIKSSEHKMYSRKTLDFLRDTLPNIDLDSIWEKNRTKKARRR